MRILITGGAGFVGQRLARRLLDRGNLVDGGGGTRDIERIVLFDRVAAATIEDPRLETCVGDVADRPTLDRLIAEVDGIFHLAAVVSGEAEADFDLGMRVNLTATRHLLEACRASPRPARLVFSSSVAVFGGRLPPVVPDGAAPTPQTSYGTQKAIGELLVNDYGRRGFVDGRSVRLPTVVVRPGKPNRAASSFASGIIREPLNGMEAVCPVDPSTVLWLSAPDIVVDNLIHAYELPPGAWGETRTVTLTGLSVSVRDMVAALERVAGAETAARIRWEIDPTIAAIVRTWPGAFDTERARQLGFAINPSFDDIIRIYMTEQAAEGSRL